MVELCLVAGAAVDDRCKNLCIRLMANNVRYISLASTSHEYELYKNLWDTRCLEGTILRKAMLNTLLLISVFCCCCFIWENENTRELHRKKKLNLGTICISSLPYFNDIVACIAAIMVCSCGGVKGGRFIEFITKYVQYIGNIEGEGS